MEVSWRAFRDRQLSNFEFQSKLYKIREAFLESFGIFKLSHKAPKAFWAFLRSLERIFARLWDLLELSSEALKAFEAFSKRFDIS